MICIADSMGQHGLGGGNPYPERPSEPDCKYYLRNGSCGYGARCKYNHPRDRGMVIPSIFDVSGFKFRLFDLTGIEMFAICHLELLKISDVAEGDLQCV